ncbi:porin [Sabulicella glaciei]|uniref:Porin n=1 Tax=Sabulicella glaciei TaxID=2984948 RepID=A0ABT3NZ15_9PROT|nr:porin [Roseococcus sp. MDT2-1-1]MCW8087173.1 porin [Roseococcus sp. MDT2-1-1]
MRKILLGTTAVVSAVVGAAVMAPEASAQQAPTVRIGGSIQAYWGYIQQSGQQSDPGWSPTTPIGVPGANGGGAAAAPTGPTGAFGRLGKHDFVTIPQFSVIVTGKLANGITYGGNIDLTFNNQESRAVINRNVGVSRSAPAVDEAYVFIAHPRLGQIRFGDEDGVMGGLMNSGWITGFGTGGVFGVWENFQTRQNGNRTQTAPGGLGDNSKIVYMTPQFFGFDFGASYAPNFGSMGQHGCISDAVNTFCDRAYAFRGATDAAIPVRGGELAARRNEWQVAARWRGNLAGVGLAATAGYIGSGTALDMTLDNRQIRTLNGLDVWQVGVQASYMGFTAGAAYFRGNTNFFWGNTIRGSRPGEQLTAGLAYTAGPLTVGANFMSGLFEGNGPSTFDPTTGAVTRNATAGRARMRRWGMGVGANYTLAPGLSLIAEYVHHSIREQGTDQDVGRAGPQNRGYSNTFILGTRLAF